MLRADRWTHIRGAGGYLFKNLSTAAFSLLLLSNTIYLLCSRKGERRNGLVYKIITKMLRKEKYKRLYIFSFSPRTRILRG